MKPIALLLTHTGDHFTIDRVMQAIERRGGDPIRVNTDTFPFALDLEAALDDHAITPTLTIDNRRIDPATVRGIWLRRLWPADPPEGLDPDMAAACARETATALNFWLHAFTGRARFVNPTDHELAAENKARQLAAARAIGLTIPPTLVTNRPDAARAFWHAHDGRVVAKMLTPYLTSMEHIAAVYTSPVEATDLDHLDGLRQSPMVFQARIEKAYELRVIIVGDQAFAGCIDATHSTTGQTDWRRARPGEVAWKPGTLTPALQTQLCAIVRRLGLIYGAADVIIRPDGTPVFLEVNPNGEWGMLEQQLDLPISDAIAARLMAPLTPEANA